MSRICPYRKLFYQHTMDWHGMTLVIGHVANLGMDT